MKHNVFVLFESFAGAENSFICMVLSLVNILEFLVLKNPIQRTSQRVKWTSAARDMMSIAR